MEGRVFVLDLEKLVGFLLVGNVSQKAEVRNKYEVGKESGSAGAHSAWRESRKR